MKENMQRSLKVKHFKSNTNTIYPYVSHMRTLGLFFSNEKLVMKIIRWINHSWKPTTIEISESRDLAKLKLI